MNNNLNIGQQFLPPSTPLNTTLFGKNSKKKRHHKFVLTCCYKECPTCHLKTVHMYNTSSFCCLSFTALSFNSLSSFNFLLLSDCCLFMYFCKKKKPKVLLRLNVIEINNINNSFHCCGSQHLSFPRLVRLKRLVKMATNNNADHVPPIQSGCQ